MTRWFSPKSKSYGGWNKPRIYILRRLVLADVHPISTIARTLLEDERPPIEQLVLLLRFE